MNSGAEVDVVWQHPLKEARAANLPRENRGTYYRRTTEIRQPQREDKDENRGKLLKRKCLWHLVIIKTMMIKEKCGIGSDFQQT